MNKKIKQNGGEEIRLDFAETVEECFKQGTPRAQKWASTMKKMTNFLLCITQLGFCCVYFIFVGNNIKQVADSYNFNIDLHVHMTIILLPILLSCLVRNLKYLAPLSAIANVCLGVGVVITLVFVCQDFPHISERKYIGEWSTLPLFFGTALFAFEGIGLVLPLRNEMKNPEQFTKPFGVLNIGMVIMTALLVLLGTLSYLKFGDEVQSSVTLNLPKGEWLSQAVQIIIGTAITLTYALQYYIPLNALLPSVLSQFPQSNPLVVEYIFRICLCLLTFLLAEVIPYLNHFISLVGAVSSTALALIFPPILEFTIAEKITPWMVMKNSVIICVALIGFLTGTIYSILSIVEAFQSEP